MSGLVVDSSLALSWCFTDEATPATWRALDIGSLGGMFVPAIWFAEIGNVLVLAERRGRITSQDSATFLDRLSRWPISAEQPTAAISGAIRLARQHSLTLYDAAYLDLSMRIGRPLGTLDKQLRAAAEKEGVELLGV